ncbi:hypothetical protein GO986_20040 [Deinococcus sp. HMF7620]|uniref:Uncharacterized protein n=1 Tax=Deinococcus arboris TaxID=2682977 RepID=A0A7C9I1X8_9DEIO|nr:hypothetical protein [Deinococcus arboris]MVN89035.1 hypothetical protein [Deinococcus arboris]
MRQMLQFFASDGWTPRVEARAPVGQDTLVMWSWPLKGTHGLGVQVYGPDGRFKARLQDSVLPSARVVVCGGRYVVGGGNTLRVWDARQDYRLISRKTFAALGQFAQLRCDGVVLRASEVTATGQTQTLRLMVPALTAVRAKDR